MTEETQDHGVADIKRIQEDDPDITKVKAWVNAGEKPGYKEISSGGYFLKTLWNMWSCLSIKAEIKMKR